MFQHAWRAAITASKPLWWWRSGVCYELIGIRDAIALSSACSRSRHRCVSHGRASAALCPSWAASQVAIAFDRPDLRRGRGGERRCCCGCGPQPPLDFGRSAGSAEMLYARGELSQLSPNEVPLRDRRTLSVCRNPCSPRVAAERSAPPEGFRPLRAQQRQRARATYFASAARWKAGARRSQTLDPCHRGVDGSSTFPPPSTGF